MSSFDYHAPVSLPEVVELLQSYGSDAHLMAGGTLMMLMLKNGLMQPAHIVSLRHIRDLEGIRPTTNGGLEIRALATHRQAEMSEDVRAYCPALAETFARVATIRIRNQGTVGGNLAHADPAQDPPAMFLALGAEVAVTGPEGDRTISIDDLFIDYLETSLRDAEVITAVRLPPLHPGTQATYLKFVPRTADDYATVSIAAVLRLGAANTCEDLRIGLGSLGPVPLRGRSVEDALRGQELTPARIREAAALVRSDVDPLADGRGSVRYKREMAFVWTERVIQGLVVGATDRRSRPHESRTAHSETRYDPMVGEVRLEGGDPIVVRRQMTSSRSTNTVVGKRTPPSGGVMYVTGRAVFGIDFELPGMLRGKIVRSTVPHARIVAIDTADATSLPGVMAVITGRDSPHGLTGARLKDEPIFAGDRVRYVGEPVCAIAAVDERTAAAAAQLVRIEYEDLIPVFEASEALGRTAPLLHENLGSYTFRPYDCHPVPGTNIASHIKIRKGDVTAGFRAADVIVEETYRTQATHAMYIEPHASVAQWDASGKVSIWTNTQAPFIVRSGVATALGIPVSRVRVIPLLVGGGFGGKAQLKLEGVCALLARAAGRPVGIRLDRAEEFTGTSVSPPFTIRIKTGARNDGTFLACEADLVIDNGAYSEAVDGVCWEATIGAAGPYSIPHQKIDGRLVYTNKLPTGPLRGFGWPQITWALEQNVDAIAVRLGIDPLEIRLRNAFEEDGSISSTGALMHAVGLKASLRAAADAIGWSSRERRPNHGFGIAALTKLSVPFIPSSSIIKINEDGRVQLISGATDIGQGSNLTMAQIAAEEIGVELDQIDVVVADTDTAPYDGGAISSRLTFFLGNAVRAAAADARSQLLATAAEMLEVASDDLDVHGGRASVIGVPDRSLAFREIVLYSHMRGGGPIIGRGSYVDRDVVPMDPQTGQSSRAATDFTYGAQAVEIEVDPRTGQVTILRVVSAHDCGFAINPLAVEGQIEGGLSMGLGFALMEEVLSEDGRVLNPSMGEYKIPTIADMPPLTSIIVEGFPHPDGPFGAKGVGEASIIGIAAAIGNALSDATGRRFTELPLSPERVLTVINGVQLDAVADP